MNLRPYQADAVSAVYDHLQNRDDNPCVVIPTGGGKTPVMATICRDVVTMWGGRVMILAHVKELLEQSAEKLHTMAPDLWHEIGVYSAGLGSRDRDKSITVAGIQSVYQRAAELGAFDIILIDEAHMIPPGGEGRYQQFLKDAKIVNPHVRLVGLTATPYRMTSGLICGDDLLLNHVCYEIGVAALIEQGYLSPLRSKPAHKPIDFEGLHVRGGEFVASEVENIVDDAAVISMAIDDIMRHASDRQSILIFAASVAHASHVAEEIRKRGHDCECVFGDTPDAERSDILNRFKARELRFVANVNVLTTGFDAPGIDCVAMLRPTKSPGLYYQMVGRGFRLHPGKNDCLILDFGGNIQRHGPVDSIDSIPENKRKDGKAGESDAPQKVCPECDEYLHAAVRVCSACGYEFPPPAKPPHDAEATRMGVLSGQYEDDVIRVGDVSYYEHVKRGADPSHPRTLRVVYHEAGGIATYSEWICFEHAQGSFARAKAEKWWVQRCQDEPCPDTAREAQNAGRNFGLLEPHTITVRHKSGEKFPAIIHYEFDDVSQHEPVANAGPIEYDEDDIPF